jgi:two-component system phosphate regulon response regulator PhoB
MAKDMQDVNEGRFHSARAAASPAAARILVVEDEAALSMLLSYNLEAEGFTVDRVERGDEAEIRLSETIPDLVILDWMLPGVSGLEICRRMRARATTRSLPVIMLTARGEESERVRGLAIGADDYVVKPFSVPAFTRCYAGRGRIARAACFRRAISISTGKTGGSAAPAARCTWGQPSSACSTI